ncbi:hypothetical protein ES702_07015 [subsurface metagenome]
MEFIKTHLEFNTVEFQEYVITHNRADRDSGELEDIIESEVLRLAGEFAEEHGIKWPVKIRKRIESPAWEEVLAQDGMGGIWEEDLVKKKRPQDYPKGRFHLDSHFRGASVHRDLRIKRNDHLIGYTITDQVEGAIKEKIKTLADARKYKWNDKDVFKFQPDMGDRNVKTVAIPKAQQPLVWLNVRNVVFPPGSVGATKMESGVFLPVDEGMAYIGVQKPYFKEWFLDGKHFKGRLVFRLIPVRPEWIKKPKAKLQIQCWMTESTPKGQLPYLLSPRGRSRKDVAPPEGESWLPPEWEKKIKVEHRWWPDSKSKQEKIKLMDEAFNDLIEKGEIKARKLKLSQELQTDTAVVLMTYGELKAKGWKDEQIIEQIAKNLLPIGFDLEYWKKKVKEILHSHGILQRGGVIRKVPAFIHNDYYIPEKLYDELTAGKEPQRSFEDFEYLLHHIHIGEKGKEEIHHCLLYDHIANMFQQVHLLVKDGKVYIDGKLIKEGIFHIIKGLEPTQEVTWSDMEARENKIKPKNMRAGMTLKEKSKEWKG